MDNKNQETKEKEFERLLKEENIDWWRPTKEDGYSLEKKLLRTGCRGIQRKFLECSRSETTDFKLCLDYEKEYQKCQQLLMFLYQTKGDLEN